MRTSITDLRAIVALVEEGSVTAAGDRLGISQSAMSHRIAGWHTALGRPLFVRCGRLLAATPETQRIFQASKDILDQIDRLFAPDTHDPGKMALAFRVASTDLERGLLLREVEPLILAKAPNSSLSFIWDTFDSRDMLRKGQTDVMIGRLITSIGSEFRWRDLVSDGFKVFFDQAVRPPPSSMDAYWQSRHARVRFSPLDDSYVDQVLADIAPGRQRRILTEVPSLWDVLPAVRGTDLLVTAPSWLIARFDGELSFCDPPFDIPPIKIGMLWHERTDYSAAHDWLRSAIIEAISLNIGKLREQHDEIELIILPDETV